MFEPHLNGFDHSPNEGSGSNLLEELDKLAPIHSFDAFPKVGLSMATLIRPDTINIYESIATRWGLDCSCGHDHISTGPCEST
jgi:hypothetical protein